MNMKEMNRRSFIKASASGALAGAMLRGYIPNIAEAASPETFKGRLRKSIYWGMFPESLSIQNKFSLAKKIGLEGVEVPTIEEPERVGEFREAAEKNSIKIHSIMNMKHWRYPFSSSNVSDIKIGIKGMETSLRNAKTFGADAVLLVPAVVNAETSYRDAYERSQKHIKEILPLARELNIVIALENVWNKFLLSPLEFARYIDEMDSPYLKAYFDVGNIALYGFPHDWIRTLGGRIAKVHIKGFDVKLKEFVNLGDGTIDWLEVRSAFSDTGYSGFINAELKGGDEAYLLDVGRRMDRIIAGQKI
ncbi:MAG: sugar phosphate isomerase/epimerase [Candidatus Latescibacteria bacterium]|jgi:L-ribulose-5-phosphate 3-epimerase|nr:sugar phosphate isomerase/epimerase [Candidatus Latescibacterota bacterium]